MNKRTSTSLLILVPLAGLASWFYYKGQNNATDTITPMETALPGNRPATVLDDAKWYKQTYQNASSPLKKMLESTPLNQAADKSKLQAYQQISKEAIITQEFWINAFAKEKIAEIVQTDSSFMEAGGAFLELSTTDPDNTMRMEYLFGKAKQLYTKAVGINPNNIMANNSLAISIIQLGQDPPMVGIGYLKKSLQVDSNDLNTNYIYAKMLGMSGQNEKAILVYNKLVLLQPSNVEYYFSLSELYGKTGEKEKAKEFLEKAKSLIKK